MEPRYTGLTPGNVGLALFSIALLCSAVILAPTELFEVALLLLVAAFVAGVAYVRRAPSGFGLADGVILVIGWVVFGTLANAVNPISHDRRWSAKRTYCLSNVKLQAGAMLMYAAEHDDHLPLADRWRTALEPLITDTDRALPRSSMPPGWYRGVEPPIKETVRCPNAKTPWSYAMNSPISGKAVGAIEEPSNQVLLFEANAALPNASGGREWVAFRHEEMASIGFADGHAKLHDAVQAAALVW